MYKLLSMEKKDCCDVENSPKDSLEKCANCDIKLNTETLTKCECGQILCIKCARANIIMYNFQKWCRVQPYNPESKISHTPPMCRAVGCLEFATRTDDKNTGYKMCFKHELTHLNKHSDQYYSIERLCRIKGCYYPINLAYKINGVPQQVYVCDYHSMFFHSESIIKDRFVVSDGRILT